MSLNTKSSQVNEFYGNKNHKHTWNITETIPIWVICLIQSWPQLQCNDATTLWRQHGKYGCKHRDGTVTAVAPQPSQAALNVIMPKTSYATSDAKADTTPTPSALVNKNNAKHYNMKISNTKYVRTYMFISAVYAGYNTLSTGQMVDILQTTFTLYFPQWIFLYKSNWLLFTTVYMKRVKNSLECRLWHISMYRQSELLKTCLEWCHASNFMILNFLQRK